MTHAHSRTLLAKLGFGDADRKAPKHDLACQYLAQPDVGAKLAETLFAAWTAARVGTFERTIPRPASIRWTAAESAPAKYTRAVTFAAPASSLERVLSKGEDAHKTTIGFLDVTIPVVISDRSHGRYRGTREAWRPFAVPEGAVLKPWMGGRFRVVVPRTAESFSLGVFVREVPASDDTRAFEESYQVPAWLPFDATTEIRHTVFVEVKTAFVSMGEVLRQIKTYAEYCDPIAGRDASLRKWVLATTYDVSAADVATLRGEGIRHIRLGAKFEAWCVARAEAAQPSDSPEV